MLMTPSFHLLIVEDDHGSARILQRILYNHYQVTMVENGQQALAFLAENPVDLILSDINMPVMDGFELIRHLQADDTLKHIPVIVVSARIDNQDVVRALKDGASDYITKPVDDRIVLARVHNHLSIKLLMDQNARVIKELQAANVMRDRFFRVASHDLKNPMNNIRMAQYLLRSSLEGDESNLVLLDNIEIALESMQSIVRDFLDTAAVQSQGLQLQWQAVPIRQVLEDVVSQYAMEADRKGIVVKILEGDGVVYADHNRVQQIITNLLSNALKYSLLESEVSIWTEILPDFVRVNVRDQGLGIPTEERNLLFTEFGRLSTRPTAGEHSTGLGLWIVAQLVQMHQGRFGMESPAEGDTGQGSIFWVELPRWDEDLCLSDQAPSDHFKGSNLLNNPPTAHMQSLASIRSALFR